MFVTFYKYMHHCDKFKHKLTILICTLLYNYELSISFTFVFYCTSLVMILINNILILLS